MKIYFHTLTSMDQLQKKCFARSYQGVRQQYSCEFVNNLLEVPFDTPSDTAIVFVVASPYDFETIKGLTLPKNVLIIVAYYLHEKDFISIHIDMLDAFEHQNVHVIYPNVVLHQLRYPSAAKIIDTVIHNTIRSKFISIQESTEIQKYMPEALEVEFNRMKEISNIIKKHNLNPDHYAGSIAVRAGQGTLITSTRTDKSMIPDDRISYIIDCECTKNEITWAGTNRPSSEASMAYLAFKEIDSAKVLLHFHFKPMTYSPRLNLYRTCRYEPYGTYLEARRVVNKLKKSDGFAIAKGHGEIFIAETIHQLSDKIDAVLAFLNIEN